MVWTLTRPPATSLRRGPTSANKYYQERTGQGQYAYVQSARRIVVDVDSEKFFDRVNHNIMIDRLQERISDAGVIWLIRAYLNSGIMDDGVIIERREGHAARRAPLAGRATGWWRSCDDCTPSCV